MGATINHNFDHIPPRQDREDAPPRGTDGQRVIITIIALFHPYLFSEIGPARNAECFEEYTLDDDGSEVSSKASSARVSLKPAGADAASDGRPQPQHRWQTREQTPADEIP